MSEVAILVPLSRVRDPWRRAAWRYVSEHLAPLGWPIITGTVEGEWCKAEAVARARVCTRAERLVVHDADVVVPLDALRAAVDALDSASWGAPHTVVHRLSASATVAALHGLALDSLDVERELVRRPYVGYLGGGVTVLYATTWDACPLDPGFRGWGAEDESWSWALRELHGEPWRGDATLAHLWHPHPAPGAGRVGHRAESLRLWRAYRQAVGRPDLMAALARRAHRALLPT